MTQNDKQTMPQPGTDGVIDLAHDEDGRFPGLVEGVDVFYPPPEHINDVPATPMRPPKQDGNK